MAKFSMPLVLVLLFSACDDPTSAGLTLAGGQKGDPIAYTASPSLFAPAEVEDVTGNKSTVLAGNVADPLLGTIEAKGYIDFTLNATQTDAFVAGPITSAKLILDIGYLYGDTTATPLLSVNEMLDDWNNPGANSDTTLTAGPNILQSTLTLTPGDSTVSFDLPQSWIDANDSTLKSVFFATSFNGFELSTDASNLVLGFDVASSVLEVVSGGDTISFPGIQSISSVTVLSAATLPADRLLMQDGTRQGISLGIDPSAIDSLSKAVLSSLILSISVDTATVAASTPANFVRPPLESIELVGTIDSLDFQIETSELDDNGRFIFDSTILRDAIQQEIISSPVFDSYKIRVSSSSNTISAFVLHSTTSVDAPPKLNIVASLLE